MQSAGRNATLILMEEGIPLTAAQKELLGVRTGLGPRDRIGIFFSKPKQLF